MVLRAFRTCTPAVVALVLFLTGCAAPVTIKHHVTDEAVLAEQKEQYKAMIRFWLEDEKRLNRVSYPILKSGVPICKMMGKVSWNDGVLMMGLDSFPEGDIRTAAEEVLHLRPDGLEVVYIMPGSRASQNGLLQTGDTITTVNGQPLKGSGKTLIKTYLEITDKLRLKEGQTISYGVLRNGTSLAVNLPVDQVCDYRPSVVREDSINAYATGEALHVHTGMMRFANDYELATVVAHELAHNAMRHVEKQRQNASAGMVGGLVVDIALAVLLGVNTGGDFARIGAGAAAGTYSQDFETEADYVGLYFMAQAGYDVKDAANFWRKMAAYNPQGIKKAYTHPTTPERFLRLRETAKEIQIKLANHQPLLPNITEETN